MSKGLSIWIIFVIIAAIIIDGLILQTQTYSGTLVNFSASAGDDVRIAGSNEISVVASATGYFRIINGSEIVKGDPKPISSQNFSGSGTLAGGKWNILDGSDITIEATSETPLNIVLVPSSSTWFGVIFMSVMLSALLILLGFLVAS